MLVPAQTGAESVLYDLVTSEQFSAATSILLIAAGVTITVLWRRLSALTDLTMKREGDTLVVLSKLAEDAKDRDARVEAQLTRIADGLQRGGRQ